MPTGCALVDKAIAMHFAKTAAVLGALNTHEREQLDQLLAKLLVSFEGTPAAASATARKKQRST